MDYLRPGGQNYPAKVDYTYDSLGRPVTKKDYFNTPGPDLTHAYTYNDRGELTADAMSRGGTYSYAYDNIGNREMSREGTAVPTAYETNELNQYISIGEGEQAVFVPEHDAAGNQTKIRTATGEWTVAYNALNQAASFTQGGKRVECRYDYMGRRVEKSVYEGEDLVSRKRFLYRNYLQIAELDAHDTTEESTPVLRKTYLWDPMESSATRIFAMRLFDEKGIYQEDLYYTHDFMKNTIALFGIQAGRRALYEYGPYGSVVKMEGNAAELNPFRFSSEYSDDELGLVYYNYRYYHALSGRWLTKDPMEEYSTLNMYRFLNNNLGIDQLGLISVSQQQPFPSGLPRVEGPPELSYKNISKKAGKCGHFRWDIQWILKGKSSPDGVIYQEVEAEVEMKFCGADLEPQKGKEKQKESWNIGGGMKDTWSYPKMFSYEEHPTEGEVTFKGTAYYTSEKPGMAKPPTWKYLGDEVEPLCKGGVCLADTSHNGLGKNPTADSNKVTRTLKISWCCCESNKDTKFES